MAPFKKVIYFLFFSFSLFFLLTLDYRPYPLMALVKAVPIFSLAALAFATIPGARGRWIGVGLLVSGVGDILLEHSGGAYFVLGLVAFLLAQLSYTLAFCRKIELSRWRLGSALLFAFYGLGMAYQLVPNLGEMLLPVTSYLVVITFMGISASLGSMNRSLVVVGAGLFVLSDSIIAIHRFWEPVALSSLWIMATYYPAQFLIAVGSQRSPS